MKLLFHRRSASRRRSTLRDLYVSGLVSVFRQDSILRVWEPLRESPPGGQRSEADNEVPESRQRMQLR